MQRSTVSPRDIEAIERATVAAVAPSASEDFDGWLLAFDSGAIGRAKCAVPLQHTAYPTSAVQSIEERYAARGYPPMFRIADASALDPIRSELKRRGYEPGRPTLVQVASTEEMRHVSAQAIAEVADAPDAAWMAIFVGPGFDPVDGASRARSLGRTPGSVYASVREDGRAIACGAASFGFGWASVHGMRTEQARRGEGLAGRVLAGLSAVALERGMPKTFLQVEDNNAAALSLYRRAGFETLWGYAYWRRP